MIIIFCVSSYSNNDRFFLVRFEQLEDPLENKVSETTEDSFTVRFIEVENGFDWT